MLLTPLSVAPTGGHALGADDVVDGLCFGQTDRSNMALVSVEVDLARHLKQGNVVVDLVAVPLRVLNHFDHLEGRLCALHFGSVVFSDYTPIHRAVQTSVHTVGRSQNPFVADHRSA